MREKKYSKMKSPRQNNIKWKTPSIKAALSKIPTLRLRDRIILYLATLLFIILSMVHVMDRTIPYGMEVVIYALAACTLFASCYYMAVDIKFGVKEKIRPGIQANSFAKRVVEDYRYRTIVFAVPGLVLNMIFALFNAAIGILNHSAWFGTLAAYYGLLSVMRFSAVGYHLRLWKRKRTQKVILDEILVYRNCGILFIIMTITLGGAVILLIHAEGGKHYPGFTIFAVAAYTFYKIIISIVNVGKAGKLKSPLLMTIRDIGYVDACVSILSLQTAMFSSFGEGKEGFATLMNGVTGFAVCLIVFLRGIHCIRLSAKMKRK